MDVEKMSVTGWKVCPSCMGAKCKLCKNLGYIGEKPAKYHNEKTEINGIKFDSKAEGEYYKYLKELEAYGAVTKIELQPSFVLQPAFTDAHGKKHAAVKYIADFRVNYKDGREIVIDVKGVQTAEFKIKRKLYSAMGWPELAVIAFDNRFGWVDSDELKKMEAAANGKPKRTAKKKTEQAAKGRSKSGKSRDL